MLPSLFLALISATGGRCSDENKSPPHIIFILADDLGWADTSLYGSTQIPTPNLDALASTDVLLSNYYVQPLCSPSRAALLTGLYPIHNGVFKMLSPAQRGGLPLHFKVIPEYLKDLGYETRMVGKWHLGYSSLNYTPTYRGFDSFFGFHTGPVDYYHGICNTYGPSGLDFWNDTKAFWPDGSTYATTFLTEKAKSIIANRDKTKPLFLYMPQQAAHSVYEPQLLEAPEENVEKFAYINDRNRTIYAGMVDAMDQSFGALFEALEEANMLQDTVLVFISDNGGDPYSPVMNWGYNWPFRGGKGTPWEGGIHAASFIWSPRLARRGVIASHLMHIVDWLPTLYSIAGGNSTSLGTLDGMNMWPTLSTGASNPRYEVLNEILFEEGTAAFRYGKYKLLTGVHPGKDSGRYEPPTGSLSCQEVDELMRNSKAAAVLQRFYGNTDLFGTNGTCNWRKTANVNCSQQSDNGFRLDDEYHLFDLEADPCEQQNIASTNPSLLSFMLQNIEEYNKTALPQDMAVIDPMAFPENNNGVWAPWIF